MKKRDELKIKHKFSNRLIYIFIILGILIIGGVYAVAPNPGHPTSDIDFASGVSTALFSTNQPTYSQTNLNTWGLSSAGTMYLEPAAGSNLWLTDSWGGTGEIKVVAKQFTVGSSDSNPNRVVLGKDGGITGDNIAARTSISSPYIKTTVTGTGPMQSYYDMGALHFGADTIYSYDKMCVGNSAGSCAGTGGSVITGSSVSSGSFLYSSDKSLKTNIQQLQNSLAKVKQLNGVSFNWKENGKADIGLIAQDVEKVFPELVSTDSEGIKSVEYGNLVGVLIEAIKEQQKQIDELKNKCN